MDVINNGILKMLQQKQWDVRHSAFNCLKYIMAVRTDLVEILRPVNNEDSLMFKCILEGLRDTNDDIKSCAICCLIPITDLLGKKLDRQTSNPSFNILI
jgi:hypothetical protein